MADGEAEPAPNNAGGAGAGRPAAVGPARLATAIPMRAAAAGAIRAAGALVRRPGAGGDEVALIHRIKYGDWTFPKGKVEPGEHVLAAAVREVAEETGIRVVLGRRLRPTSYDNQGRPKRVDYWAARVATGASMAFVPNSEVDDLEWLPLPAASRRLSYSHDARLLAELAAGPSDTVPVILLRHASAGAKSSWAGDDLARPLDPGGTADAERLASLLSCYGSCRVISSAAERCIATVRPYAQRVGKQISVDPGLTVTQPPAGPAAVTDLAVRLTAERLPTVLCAHRENLPPVLAAICGDLGAVPPGGPELDKGGFWVLHTAEGALAGAERHSPRPPVPGS
ncbi:MAG: NUDIX domain-containing protein [Streptosporangiaceae bacterium]|jgi:8-oxo-dGTP diphosphatase